MGSYGNQCCNLPQMKVLCQHIFRKCIVSFISLLLEHLMVVSKFIISWNCAKCVKYWIKWSAWRHQRVCFTIRINCDKMQKLPKRHFFSPVMGNICAHAGFLTSVPLFSLSLSLSPACGLQTKLRCYPMGELGGSLWKEQRRRRWRRRRQRQQPRRASTITLATLKS